MKQHPIISALIAHVTAECNAVDVEARFDSMIDESYDFSKVGGPFEHMSPSRVLREMDPTAHRCGVADFSDGEPWTEVDGSYYEDDALDKAKAEFVEEREGELRELEGQLSAGQTEDPVDESSQTDITSEIVAKQAEIAALEAHSF